VCNGELKACGTAIALGLSVIKRGCNRSANKIPSSELEPVIIVTCTHLTRDILVSEVGGSDPIGFISSGYDSKYVKLVSEVGSFRELLVTAGSIHDSRGYLPAVSDQGPGSVDSFRRMDLRAWFYQTIFYSERTLQFSHNYSLALCRYHLILGHYQAGSAGSCTRDKIYTGGVKGQ
jgi:hypothetical protein